jgi:peroxiredoxin/predicted negative regulator of RcsB-dependent stress response
VRHAQTIFALILLAGVGAGWAQKDTQPLLEEGDRFSEMGNYEDAYKSYEKANRLSANKCAFCLLKMAMVKLSTGEEDSALKLADKSLALSATNQQRADSYGVKGEILSAFALENKKKFAAAEDAYRNAIKEDSQSPIFHMKLGRVLLREGKIDEGRDELNSYLASHPNSADAEIVSRWLKFPDKAKFATVPEFEVRTSTGEEITSEKLAGKVVVLDFWATWCPPCRASVPELKDLILKYPADRLAVISVSSDTNPEQWRKFIADKQMTWPQYIDSDHHMTKLFGIRAFPTYIVIDGDGFVRERIMSFNPQQSLAFRLKEPLKKLLE